MMNFILKVLKLIPVKALASNAPKIIAFILTKAMKWLSENRPEHVAMLLERANDVVHALEVTLKAGDDKQFEPKEIEEIAQAWKEAFD